MSRDRRTDFRLCVFLFFRNSCHCEARRAVAILIKQQVIANQSADWCGNPLDIPETLGDCHVAFGSSQ